LRLDPVVDLLPDRRADLRLVDRGAQPGRADPSSSETGVREKHEIFEQELSESRDRRTSPALCSAAPGVLRKEVGKT
jgi:hypothetical protein